MGGYPVTKIPTGGDRRNCVTHPGLFGESVKL
jgi:hypothetical protein